MTFARASISAHSVDIQEATISDLPLLFDMIIGALNSLLPGSFAEACANSDTRLIFNLRHNVMKNKDVFTALLLKRVQQLGLDLMEEGGITIPPLEWDGALGPREVNVIERLGFLLDAYQAKVWYWEVKAFPPLPTRPFAGPFATPNSHCQRTKKTDCGDGAQAHPHIHAGGHLQRICASFVRVAHYDRLLYRCTPQGSSF